MKTVPFVFGRGLLCALILPCFLSVGFAAEEGGGEAAEAADLKVMSFNIRYGTANDGKDAWPLRKEMVFDTFRRQDADVAGLQEALRFQIDEILEALPQYAFVGVGRDDAKNKGEFSPVLYRKDRFELLDSGTFWLSDTPEEVASTTWGNSIPRICSWARLRDKVTGKAFYFYNVHLDHRSANSRLKSVQLVSKRIAEREHRDDPVVLTGDFNAGENNPPIAWLKGNADGEPKNPAPMIDAYRVTNPDETVVGTFNGFRGATEGAKIDYVFVEPGTKVLAAEIDRHNVDGKWPSDHMPVTARVRFE